MVKNCCIALAAILILASAAGKLINRQSFSSEVSRLFAASDDYTKKKFTRTQLNGLPQPVQQYFRYALQEGQPYISTVRLAHTGFFKLGVDRQWITITGQQYYTAQRPGFIWKGNTSMFEARDQYIQGAGSLTVYLFGILRVINGHGAAYNQGELLRWLGECVWFPTSLLPSENLSWSPIDAHSAKLSFTCNGQTAGFIVTFNDKGQITSMQTKRYMDASRLENWVIVCSDYREINGVKVPFYAEAMWRLPEKDFSYARFTITHIEYGLKEQF